MSSKSKISSTDDDSTKTIKEQKSIILDKLTSIKKENQKLEQENTILKNELSSLHNTMRLMLPGFSSNTSNSFPMLTELTNKINDYIKLSCEDIFFDLLQPNLNLEGTVNFYKFIFSKTYEIIYKYFIPIENAIYSALFIDQIYESIDNVLRKSYQYNWKNFFEDIKSKILYKDLIEELCIKIKLDFIEEDGDEWNMIKDFMNKTLEIIFYCYISDPVINIDMAQIGKEVKYNNMMHDSLDGFIKNKQNSTIILPNFYKGKIESKNTILIKPQALANDYEFS